MQKRSDNDDTYTTLVRGFDAEIKFKDTENTELASVILYETGADVFETEIDTSMFYAEEGDTYTEDLIDSVATAAVDQFEASRATLGQGATAVEGNMKKRAWFEAPNWEEWFMAFKGTQLESQAEVLLDRYLSLGDPNAYAEPESEYSKVYAERELLIYKMDRLYFDAMKADTGRQTVIVINANTKTAYLDAEALESWLIKFDGTRWEAQALDLAREYVDLSAKLTTLDSQKPGNDLWEQKEDLRSAMAELKLQLLQQNLDNQIPQEGPELAPSMMNDLYELAEGVSFEAPLEPMSEGLVASITEREDYEPLEVVEKGQMHEGLDPAEVEVDRAPFNVSENIELSKEFEQVLWGGIKKKYPKGTKGVIDDLGDRQGNEYYIRLTDKDYAGRLLRVPFEYLIRKKKG